MTESAAWPTAKLDELATVARGKSRHRPRNAPHLYGGPYPFVQTGEVKAAEFWIRGIEQSYSLAGLEQSRLWPAGTVCVTIAANIAESGMLGVDACFPDSVVGVQATEGVANSSYLKYALDYMKLRLQAVSTGTTQDNLSLDKLLRFDFPAPPLEDQLRIGSALRSFDDLIENNRRRVEILEEMARLLYREWFVHFRFPGHEDVEMVDSELGPIPEGWVVASLGDVVAINPEAVRKGDDLGTILYVDISSVGPRTIDEAEEIEFDSAPGRARRRVIHGDVIWSTVRPNRRSHVMIQNPPPNLICSTGFAVIRGTAIPPSFVLELCSTDRFVGHLESLATGAAYPAVRPPDFEAYRFALPSEDLVICFDDQARPLNDLVSNLRRQNRVLQEARDLLLPRLVSGELDVSELDLDEVLA